MSGFPVNPPICQSLAGDAFKNLVGARCIFDAKGRTLVITEIEFAKVALKVLLADVVIDARDPAFQKGEIAFHGMV